MTESSSHIVQEAESIVSAADAPSANSVDPSRANKPSPSGEACPCGCNREETSCLFDEMPDEELLYDLADLFKVFADTTRIKILYALMGHSRCVADIAEIVGATQSAVSHQLRILKQARERSLGELSCALECTQEDVVALFEGVTEEQASQN